MDRKVSFSGICRSELGRTMLETLGVLALMGIISLLGVLSYGYAMRQYRENETVDQFTKTIASARTGFIKEQYMDKMRPVQDSSGNLVYRPIIIPIRDMISGVDFNDENGPCPYDNSDYCEDYWPESFHTLIGADISVQVDNPEEFSVMLRGKSKKEGDYIEGHSVCRKLLGANFGHDWFYLKSLDGSSDSVRYSPKDLMNNDELIEELCDQAIASAEEGGSGHFRMSLVFVFGNTTVSRCERDSDCVPSNEYEQCNCIGGMCICNEPEDLCYTEKSGLLTQEILGGNLSGAWASLSDSGLPTLTGSGKIGADCCEGAMNDINQSVGYYGSSPGFVYVDYKTGMIDCCQKGVSYELVGGPDVRHPTYYYIDDDNDEVYLRYAICNVDRVCGSQTPYLCLDGCCSTKCEYDGYCSKVDNGCSCPTGEICLSAIMDSRSHDYFSQGSLFDDETLCCSKEGVYYDLMTNRLSCCEGTVDVQGGSYYLMNGRREVPSGCCGECGTLTIPEETTVIPFECVDPAYPYACLDNTDDSYGLCCSESGCGGECSDPVVTTNTQCPDASKPYWCSGSQSCCSKPCVGDQCVTDCGTQEWCAKGGENGRGACCDECCEDGRCATDYEGGECPVSLMCQEDELACYDEEDNLTDCCVTDEICNNGTCESFSCGAENSSCEDCDGMAICDIINLTDGSYFGSSATYGDSENTCCASDATVYVRSDGKIDCCPADETFTQSGVSDYADNSDGGCSPRIPVGVCGDTIVDPCAEVGSGTACYATDGSGSYTCCSGGYECVNGQCVWECPDGYEACGTSCCDSNTAECKEGECSLRPPETCPASWICPTAVGYYWDADDCECKYDPCYPDEECPISCGECYYPTPEGECVEDESCTGGGGGGGCSIACVPEECYPDKDEANCTCGESVCDSDGGFNPYCSKTSEERRQAWLVYQKSPKATCVSEACCEGTFGGDSECDEVSPRIVTWTNGWTSGDGICCKLNDTPYKAGRDSSGNPTTPWACCSHQTQKMCGDGKTCCDLVSGYSEIEVCYKEKASSSDYSCCSTGDIAHPRAGEYECCFGAKIYTPNSCDKPEGGQAYTQCCDGERYQKKGSDLLNCSYWGCCDTLVNKDFVFGEGTYKTCCANGTQGYMDGDTPRCCAGEVGNYNGTYICCQTAGTRPINATTCCATGRVYVDNNGVEQCCSRDLNNGTCSDKVKKCGSDEEVDCLECDISNDNCCCV